MSYSVVDLSKGVVDEKVLSKLDSNYRRKMIKGDNVYITKENTVKTRPSISNIEGVSNAIDAIEYGTTVNDEGETVPNIVYLQRWEGTVTLKRVQDAQPSTLSGHFVSRDLPDVSTVDEDVTDILTACFTEYKKGVTINNNSQGTTLDSEATVKVARIDDIKIVTILEPDLYVDKEVTHIYFLDADNTVTASYFTDTNFSTRLDQQPFRINPKWIVSAAEGIKTAASTNEGTWVVTNENYLPSELVYNHLDNTIIFNMLGELYKYNGEKMFSVSGTPDNVENTSVQKFFEKEEVSIDDLPLIAQVIPQPAAISGNVITPYTIRGNIDDILNPVNHFEATNTTERNNKQNIDNILETISENRNNIKFALLEVNPTCTNDTDFGKSLDSDKIKFKEVRHIAPDIKLVLPNSDLVQNRNIKRFDIGLVSVVDQLFSKESTEASGSMLVEGDSRFRAKDTTFTNGSGYSIGSDGICFTYHPGSSRDAFYNPYLTLSVNASDTQAGTNPRGNHSIIKLNIDYSHPNVINLMNNLKIVNFFRSGGDRYYSDILINLDTKTSDSSNVDTAFNSLDNSGLAATGALQKFLRTGLPPKSLLYRMVSTRKLVLDVNDVNPRATSAGIAGQNGGRVLPWLNSQANGSSYTPRQGVKVNHIFSTLFANHDTLNESSKIGFINNRLVIETDKVNYSTYRNVRINNVGYKNYIRSNIYTSRDLTYLAISGAPDTDIPDITNPASNNEPQQFDLLNENVTNISLLDVRSNNEGVITTSKRLLRAAGNSSGQVPVLVEIDDIGCDEGALSKYTSSIISSQDGLVRQTLYSERVNGFVSNLINKETKLPNIIDMVQLITKHRVILCLHEKKDGEEQLITCFSLGSEAQIKGLTKWWIPDSINFPVDKLVKTSEDRVLLLGTEGAKFMDLDSGFTGKDDDGGTGLSIQWVVQPTPIRFNAENYFSVKKPQPISDIAIGVAGEPVFTVRLIDRAIRDVNRGTSDQPYREMTSREFRESGPDSIENASEYIGVVLWEGVSQNAARLPAVQIEGDGSVTEITSIDFIFRR